MTESAGHDEAATPGTNEDAAGAPPKASPVRRILRALLLFSLPMLLVAGGVLYWYSTRGQVSTDNAYVQQDKVAVAPEVGGILAEVAVREGQAVSAGEILFRIDEEPFRVEVARADAAIASAQANVIALANDSKLSGSDIAAARSDIDLASARLARQRALWDRGFTTKADLEEAEHELAQARERLRTAQALQREARAQLAHGAAVPGIHPAIAAGRAQRAAADLDLRRTVVRAPVSGHVAQADRLQRGQQVVAGLPVLTVVTGGSAYVEANFKETDLADMKPGQPAEVRIDAYPGLVLKGRVASIGAGTGAEFSVLPAQNATGNWVKVTQRVPVRIAIEEESPRRLISGLSSEVTVFTDGRKR